MNQFAKGLQVTVLLLLSACAPKLEVPEPSRGELDFSRTVFIGGHYLSGYRDGALTENGQMSSVSELLFSRFQIAQGSGLENNHYALMTGEGFGINLKPWESDFQSVAKLGYKTDCEGVSGLSPLKTLFDAPAAGNMLDPVSSVQLHNFSAPFARLSDLNDPAFGLAYPSGNPYYHRFASNAGVSTLFGDALAANPSFFFLWTGMEDIFEYASTGGKVNNLPSAAQFRATLDSMIILLKFNGAKGLLADLPHISTFPYFTTIAWDGLELSASKADSLTEAMALGGLPIVFVEGRNGFVIEDPAAIGGYRKMIQGEYINLSMPVDSIKCFLVGVAGEAMPDRYVLDSAEMRYLNNLIDGYNQAVHDLASTHGIGYFYANYFFEDLKAGKKADGIDFNSTFVSGNFFSLDGYTPTGKGAGLIVNEILHFLNVNYDCFIPGVEITELDGVYFP